MQHAVTVRAVVREAFLPSLRAELAAVDAQLQAGTGSLNGLEDTHFARLMILAGDQSLPSGPGPASLIYLAEADEPAPRHLRRLGSRAPAVIDSVFQYCDGFPENPDPNSRYRWLLEHRIKSAAFYVNTIGLRASQVVEEAELHDWLEEYLDSRYSELAHLPAAAVHRALRAAIADDPPVEFALHPARGLSLAERVRRLATMLILATVLLLLLPVIIVVGVPWLIALRLREWTDGVETARPDHASLTRLRSREDQFAFNPFAAAGQVKPGKLRRFTVILVLRAINLGATFLFARGTLAGVTTIHFARWVPIDDHRRIVFTSCYDGSLESYMDDFIDKLAWGLNLIFSNGVGYPRTRWLIFGGASDEQSFKDYLRLRQIETAVSYATYPTLTTANVINNAAIRYGLGRTLDDAAAATWLARL